MELVAKQSRLVSRKVNVRDGQGLKTMNSPWLMVVWRIARELDKDIILTAHRRKNKDGKKECFITFVGVSEAVWSGVGSKKRTLDAFSVAAKHMVGSICFSISDLEPAISNNKDNVSIYQPVVVYLKLKEMVVLYDDRFTRFQEPRYVLEFQRKALDQFLSQLMMVRLNPRSKINLSLDDQPKEQPVCCEVIKFSPQELYDRFGVVFNPLLEDTGIFETDLAVLQKISREAMTFYEENKIDDNEFCKRFFVSQKIDEVCKWAIHQLFPAFNAASMDVDVRMVGSTLTRCGSRQSSDLDLVVFPSYNGFFFLDYRIPQLTLPIIYDVLVAEGYTCEYVNAVVPIVKTTIEGYHIDIAMNRRNSLRHSKVFKKYASLDKRFEVLCVLVKHWASVNGYNHGGRRLNSISLVMMVTHFLQCGVNPPLLPSLPRFCEENNNSYPNANPALLFDSIEMPKNELSIGQLLLGFFQYFQKFDFGKYRISLTGQIQQRNWEYKPYDIHIDEPYDYTINTASCFHSRDTITYLQGDFKETVDRLKSHGLQGIFPLRK